MSETYLRIRTILETAYAEADKELKFYAEIRRMLVEKFVGKQINKRVITYIKSQHPSWVVNFYGVGVLGGTYIRVWGGDSGFTYDDHARVFIGYPEAHIDGFSVEKFDEYNQQIPNTVKEQARREGLLSEKHTLMVAANAIENYIASKDALVRILEELPDHYEMEKIAGLRD